MNANPVGNLNTNSRPPEFIKLLANDMRWGVLKALCTSDQQVNELVTLLHQPMNLVSYHLKKLRDSGIVTTRRSEADGRDVYYSLDLDRLCDLYFAAGEALHPALNPGCGVHEKHLYAPMHVLFVCTHNSARSQMAEGLLRHLTDGQVAVFSAGSHPTQVHMEAVRAMDALGVDIREQSTHHFHDYTGVAFDYVITVCDKAREVCPTFPGEGQHLHWGFPDPAVVADELGRREAFLTIAHRLEARIRRFLLSAASAQS